MKLVLSELSRDVLMVTAMQGASQCAAVIAAELDSRVEIASTRRGALQALRKSEFGVVIVEAHLLEDDGDWADQIWLNAGLAMPLQVNFAISNSVRLVREIRCALQRREGEQAIARRAAATAIENDLKGSITGLLLESQLALREPTMSAALAPKVQHLVELAGQLREKLRQEAA